MEKKNPDQKVENIKTSVHPENFLSVLQVIPTTNKTLNKCGTK